MGAFIPAKLGLSISDNLAGLSSDWQSVAARYSGLKLTKSDDKIIALAGIAEEFRRKLRSIRSLERSSSASRLYTSIKRAVGARTTNENNPFFDAYVAGSWMLHITDDLLWEETREEEQDGDTNYLKSRHGHGHL